jgi:Anaphase-promoting complex, cyclosome, subunit 3/PEGA domain
MRMPNDYNSSDTMQPPQILAIISGGLIVLGLFLPWIQSFLGTLSGFDILRKSIEDDPKALLVLIPSLIGIYAIFASIYKQNPKTYGVPSLIVFAYLLFKILSGASKLGVSAKDLDDAFELLIKVIGIGLHLTWVGLFGLCIIGFVYKLPTKSIHLLDEDQSQENEIDKELSAIIDTHKIKIEREPDNINILYEYAEFLFLKKLYDDAIAVLHKIIILDKGNIQSNKLLYQCYKSNNEREKALNQGLKLLNIPIDEADIFRELSDIAGDKKEDLKNAIIFINKALSLDSDNKQLLLKKAYLQNKNNNKSETFYTLKKAYQIDPKDKEVRLNLGLSLYQLEKYESALTLYKKLLGELLKDGNDYLKCLIYCILSENKLDPSKDVFRIYKSYLNLDNIMGLAIENENDLADFSISYANYCMQEKHFKEAISLYDKAKSLNRIEEADKGKALVLYHHAKELFGKSNIKDAEVKIKQAIQLDDKNEYVELLGSIDKLNKKRATKLKFAISFALIIVVIGIGIWYAAHGDLRLKLNTKADIRLLKGNKHIASLNKVSEFNMNHLQVGNYKISIESEGYENKSQEIKIGWLSKTNEKVDLVPKLGSVKIDSRPNNMDIKVDGAFVGKTPKIVKDLLAKNSIFELSGNGYYWGKKIKVKKDAILDLGRPICDFSLGHMQSNEIINPEIEKASYYADFGKQNGGWGKIGSKYVFGRVENGHYVYGTNNYGSRFYWGSNCESYGDYWYGAKVKKVSKGYNNEYYGICFKVDYIPKRKNKYDNRWSFFGINDKGKYYLQIDSRNETQNGKLNTSFNNSQVHLAVECKGNIINCYVDGKKVATQTTRNGCAGTGTIGLGIDSSKITVEYDDLYVKQIKNYRELGDVIYNEKFNKLNKKVTDKYNSKYLKLDQDKAKYINWKSWVWNSFDEIEDGNYSIAMTTKAIGEKAEWGPIFMADYLTKYDGNQEKVTSYCLGFKINKNKRWTIFAYNRSKNYRMDELRSGGCNEIKPLGENIIRVDKYNRELRFFINNQYVAYLNIDCKDLSKHHFGNKFGFYVNTGEAHFDDIKVHKLI